MMRRPALPWVRVGGRLLVAGCLLLALLPPPLPWTRAPLDLFALIDDSLSMPRSFSDSAWQQLRTLLAGAPAGSRLHLIRFGANAVPEDVAGFSGDAAALPRTAALDRTATDIANALHEALRMVRPGQNAVMVLVSDTAATQGDTQSALRAVRRANVPLYLLAPAAAQTGGAASLQELQLPARVNAGDEVPVVALVAAASGGRVAVTLEIDGRREARQVLELAPGEPAFPAFRFVAGAPGVSLVTVRLEQDPAGGVLDGQTRAVNVLGPAPVLYVAPQGGASPIVDSLRLAGWEVATAAPAELDGRRSLLQRAGAVILDNLAIGDVSETAWQALVKSVQVDGKGLAVLGGPRSFGAGAYRHSMLEQILPVTAEAADPQEPAAVMFLLDRSGSMGREQAGPSRLAMARQAVAASVAMLLPDDYLGIATFATAPEIRLPLATRQAGSDRVAAALDVAAAGGTRLAPALQLAAQQLRGVDVRQRMIVLVTDGFAGEEDLEAEARALDAAGITVIALAVGADPKRETLQRLTGFNRGRILSVTDAATLPRLMTGAVAMERAPTVAAATLPVAARALPFPMAPVAAWPPLAAYMVSKARPGAQVYLQSQQGDPLFAGGLAGAGRVAALPAGLGPWASAWWRWPQFGAFLGGLMHWLDPGYGADGLSLEVTDLPGELLFSIDLQSAGEWDSQEQPGLLVDDPAGARTRLAPALQAPGRYQATLAAIQPGLYRTTLQAGGRTLHYALYRDESREMHAAARPENRLRYWLDQGWLRPWTGGDELLRAGPRDAAGLRRLMLALALCSYLLLLLVERGLAGPAVRRLRARFSR